MHGACVAAKGLQGKFGVFGEELVAQSPGGVEEGIVFKIVIVVILDDAADLDVGKCEGFGEEFERPGFDYGVFVNLSIEIGYGAVRANSSGSDIADADLFVEGDLDIGVLASLFGQNFNANIIVFRGSALRVVAVDLAIEVDGRVARGFGQGGHLHIFGGDGLPFVAGTYGP